jgi:hypothetical protein
MDRREKCELERLLKACANAFSVEHGLREKPPYKNDCLAQTTVPTLEQLALREAVLFLLEQEHKRARHPLSPIPMSRLKRGRR